MAARGGKSLMGNGLAVIAGLALVACAVSAAAGPPEPVDGPCRVKLRSGRAIEAASLLPVDAGSAFWRVSLVGGGAVVLPVRELKSVERLAIAPAPADVATVAPPPEALEPVGTCDPAGAERLVRWDPITAAAAERHGVDHALVRAIIAVESCGNPDAVSRKGAVGLMQLMPATARDYGCANPRDPEANVDAGCRHLARLLAKLGGASLDVVLAAYNAGEGAVAKAGGVPKFRETEAYVRDVKRHLRRLGSAPHDVPAM